MLWWPDPWPSHHGQKVSYTTPQYISGQRDIWYRDAHLNPDWLKTYTSKTSSLKVSQHFTWAVTSIQCVHPQHQLHPWLKRRKDCTAAATCTGSNLAMVLSPAGKWTSWASHHRHPWYRHLIQDLQVNLLVDLEANREEVRGHDIPLGQDHTQDHHSSWILGPEGHWDVVWVFADANMMSPPVDFRDEIRAVPLITLCSLCRSVRRCLTLRITICITGRHWGPSGWSSGSHPSFWPVLSKASPAWPWLTYCPARNLWVWILSLLVLWAFLASSPVVLNLLEMS